MPMAMHQRRLTSRETCATSGVVNSDALALTLKTRVFLVQHPPVLKRVQHFWAPDQQRRRRVLAHAAGAVLTRSHWRSTSSGSSSAL